MSYAAIDPRWDKEPDYITEHYSIEMTAKDVDAIKEVAPKLPAGIPVAVTFLPSENLESRLTAAKAVKALGFEPVPHFSARRFKSEQEFRTMVERMAEEAGAKRCFAIAGDCAEPQGPFPDTSSLIETGLFEKNGFVAIGMAGHPQGHPNMTDAECFEFLQKKSRMIHEHGMKPVIVTQFGFDPDGAIAWLEKVRALGIDAPVRLGVPGPTNIKTLLKFSARCGVSASASVMTKYGISLTKLLGTAGPDKMVDAFSRDFHSGHGRVRIHFYPFGGLSKTIDWVNAYTARLGVTTNVPSH